MILLDTNILLRSKQAKSEHHEFVTNKLLEFASLNEPLIINSQVIYEFYVVASRPVDRNGLGLKASTVNKEIDNLLDTYFFIDDTYKIFQQWRNLTMQFDVYGKAAHDARIVAFMLANDIRKIFTLNQKDFDRYSSQIQLV